MSGTEGAAWWGWEEGGHPPSPPQLCLRKRQPACDRAGWRLQGDGPLDKTFLGARSPSGWWCSERRCRAVLRGGGRQPAPNHTPLSRRLGPGTGLAVPGSPWPCVSAPAAAGEVQSAAAPAAHHAHSGPGTAARIPSSRSPPDSPSHSLSARGASHPTTLGLGHTRKSEKGSPG